MTKAALRKIYLQKRLSIPLEEFKEVNARIASNFFASIDVTSIQVLHTFLPIQKTREPDTWLIIERIRKEFPDTKISVPKINDQTAELDNFYYEGPDQLENNTWGIPEPKQGVPTPIEKIDAVLVPLLAFDLMGNRVGYGRGFYDKFLAKCNSRCSKIGLSFFPAVEKISDIGPQDLPLDVIVSPDEIFKVSSR